MRLRLERKTSPIGIILFVTDMEGVLRAVDFAEHEDRLHRLLRLHYGAFDIRDAGVPIAVTEAFEAYIDGDLPALDTLAIETGGTAFQRAVWASLRRIPVGTTSTYGQLAAQLGRPAASRAVGAANGANPLSIVVPCHRLVGAGGALTGYAGGLDRKRWLLDHEQRHGRVAR